MKTKTPKQTNFRIADAELAKAYADCDDSNPNGYAERNLNFTCSVTVTKAEAIKIFTKRVPHGYNEFSADVLKHLPEDSVVRLSRQGSPCLLVETAEVPNASALKADECDIQSHAENGKSIWRVWWD